MAFSRRRRRRENFFWDLTILSLVSTRDAEAVIFWNRLRLLGQKMEPPPPPPPASRLHVQNAEKAEKSQNI